MYHHFPVGSFLFWQTDDEIQSYRRIGEIELRHDQGKFVQYVLDGQQRITSLFASLEQAQITYRINGKQVTKSLQIYFDLDEEQFVPDPFISVRERSPAKLLGLPTIGSTNNYLKLLVSLLRTIDENQPSPEQVVVWLVTEFNVSVGLAGRLHRLLQRLDLYTVADEVCSATEAGQLLAQDESPRGVLRQLVANFDYFADLLPALAARRAITEEDAVTLLTETREDEIKSYRVQSRLKWLADLGLGSLKDTRFRLSTDGQALVDEIVREAEIQEHNKHEEEADKRSRYFSVREITDFSKLMEAATRLDPGRHAALVRVHKRFASYPFSTIDVLEQPIDTACEIFERINNSGKVLNIVDLMVAKTWSPTFNLRERLNEFREELATVYYDDVPNITILQCVAGVLTKAVRRKDILNIGKAQIQEHWDVTLESIRQAIDFLKGDLRIAHARILPYNSVIVPLTYFFFATDTKVTQAGVAKKTLAQWFWKVSVSSRYDATAETRLGDDIADIDKLAGGETVTFAYAAPPLSAERIIEQRLNLGSAFCKTLLCVLNRREPRELKDGSPVSLTSFSKFNSAEFHHLFPRAYLQGHDAGHRRLRDSMANIALARASANKTYASKAPSKYLKRCRNPELLEALRSHFVDDPEASGLLTDDFETFLQYRAEQILAEMRLLTGEMEEVETDFHGNEARAIEKFELRLRELIDSVLRKHDPGYWPHLKDGDLRGRIEERINDWLRQQPSRARTDIREVDFCQIREYYRLIKAYWSLFEPLFKSRSNLDMHLGHINNFINALMHNRELELSTRSLALGSLAWFDGIFHNK